MNEIGERAVILRPVHESDLDALFRQGSDPESVRMAAFTPEDPHDRQWFDAHMVRVMESPENTRRPLEREQSELAPLGRVSKSASLLPGQRPCPAARTGRP